jgi:hypothetical protein
MFATERLIAGWLLVATAVVVFGVITWAMSVVSSIPAGPTC